MNPSFFVHKGIFFTFMGMINLIDFIYTVYFCSIFINSKIILKRERALFITFVCILTYYLFKTPMYFYK